MPDQKPMWTRCLGGFSVKWVTKLLISPVKKRIFCPKTTKFGPELAFLVNLGQAMQAYSMPCCGSVGGCGARAVSRKTPIYFIFMTKRWHYFKNLYPFISSCTLLCFTTRTKSSYLYMLCCTDDFCQKTTEWLWWGGPCKKAEPALGNDRKDRSATS